MTEAVSNPAFVGKAYLAVGNGGSPETFARYCEVDTMSGLGQKNALVDVTTFCSGGVMEYVAGLSDGSEFSWGANYAIEDDGDGGLAVQDGLIDDVEAKVNRNFTVTFGDSSPPEKIFTFKLAMLSWEITPSVSKQNVIKFTGKVTGQIARS